MPASVARILDSGHAKLEVIVIDDGSTDGTSDVVRERFGTDPRVKLITIPNGGKARAVNTGLAHRTARVVVALDADTQFEPDTIARLARWFGDETIGAVAGNAKVGNRINLLTRWQALEYITAQNLERRALAAFDCITVVPGAVGAWRRSRSVEAWRLPDGYPCRGSGSHHCHSEGRLPGRLRSRCRRVDRGARYGRRARQATVPLVVRHPAVLVEARGRDAATPLRRAGSCRAAAGVAVPDRSRTHFAVRRPAAYRAGLSPSLPTTHSTARNSIRRTSRSPFSTTRSSLRSTWRRPSSRFLFEKRENWGLLWWLVLQRFGYRQLLYYVLVKSVTNAAKGHFVGWGKLERKATVNLET